MKTINALSAFISLIHGDRAATIGAATAAYEADYGHFARANNRGPLEAAIVALKKSPRDRAIAEAINAGQLAGGLVAGYIGAQSGKFSAQPDDVQATFIDAVARAADAFRLSLEGSEAFAEKKAASEEEKASAKLARQEKADKIVQDTINAKIIAGELVRADQVGAAVTLAELSPLALIDELASRTLDDNQAGHLTTIDNVRTLAQSLATITAERDALAQSLALVTAERDALATAKKAAAKKAAAKKAATA